MVPSFATPSVAVADVDAYGDTDRGAHYVSCHHPCADGSAIPRSS